MTESIGTARLDIVVDTSSLDAGVNKAKRSTQDMAKASQDASQKMDAGTKRQVASLERQIATLGKSRSEVIKWRIEQQTSGRVAAELTAKLDAQSRRLSTMGSSFDRMGASAKRLAANWVALGAAATTAAIGFGVKNAIEFADQLNDINQRLGISAEALSGWAFAAKQTGTDIDALGVGMIRLAKNMGEATKETSSQAKIFAALGVDAVDPVTKSLRSLEDVLPEIATRFKAIENETLKAALAQELFGKSGTQLIEFLNQGSDGLEGMRDRARELGVELSQGTLTAADKFNDTLAELKSASQGLFTALAVALLPEMTKLSAKLTELVADGDRTKKFVSDLSTVVSGTAHVFEFAAGQVAVMISQLAALKTTAEGVINLDWSQISRGLAQGMAAQSQGIENTRRFITGETISPQARVAPGLVQEMDLTLGAPMTDKERAAFEKRVTGALGSSGGGAKKAKKEGKSEAERELDRLKAAYESFAASQRERIALFGNESEAVKVRYELEHGELSKLTDAQAKRLGIDKEALIVGAQELDQLKAKAKRTKEIEDAQERGEDVLQSIRDEQALLGKSIEFQDTWNKLKYVGADASDALRQSIIEENHALHENGRAMERHIELMDTFRTEASSAITDVVMGTKSLSEAFSDMFDNIAERITQMIADRWIEQLFGQMGTGGGGQSGDWIGKLFGIFSGMGGGGWNGAGGPGWSEGGYTGAGGTLEPAGVVHKGEVVWSQKDVYRAGGVAVVEGMRQGWRGYASGGVVGDRVVSAGGSSVPVTQIFHTHIQGRLDRSTQEQMDRRTGSSAARGISRTGRR